VFRFEITQVCRIEVLPRGVCLCEPCSHLEGMRLRCCSKEGGELFHVEEVE